MARLESASEIYAAAQQWLRNSVIRSQSLFAPEFRTWTVEDITALRKAFTETPIVGEQSFEKKFERQLHGQPADVTRLAAEMLWVLLLFARKAVSPERKRELITTVWGWTGEPLDPDHPLLSPGTLAGIGNAGTAFNTQRDRELEGLIDAVLKLKELDALAIGVPDKVAEALDTVPKTARRNIRNILLHLLFPGAFERMASNSHKQLIVKAFADLLPDRPVLTPILELDRQLRTIREELQEQSPHKPVDFYEHPWRERWWPLEPKPGDGTRRTTKRSDGRTSKRPLRVNFRSTNEETRAAVWLATSIANGAGHADPTRELLFAAFMLLSADTRYASATAKVVNEALQETQETGTGNAIQQIVARYNVEIPHVPDTLPEVTTISPDLVALTAEAELLRRQLKEAEADKAERLSPRHIIGVLLGRTRHSILSELERLDVNTTAVRNAFLRNVTSRQLGPNRKAWRRALDTEEINLSAPLADTDFEPLPVDVSFYAGFSTDAIPSDDADRITEKDDRLDVMKDVTALCEVLAAQKTDPPLAVGLFGDWGTGKSFFMELMRKKIRDLGTENADFYCPRVVQVWFNAWHYMDTNLWASLAARVFEELAEHVEKWEPRTKASATLFEQLQESRGMLAEAVYEKDQARARVTAIQTERQQKQQSIAATAVTAFHAAAAALADNDEIKQKLADARRELKLDEAKAVVTRAGEQARELRTLGGRAKAVGRALLGQPLFLVLGIAVFAGVTFGARWLLDRRFGWDQASSLVTALTSALALATAAVAPVLKRVGRAIGWIEDVATRLQQQRESEQRQEELALQRDLMRLDEREREAQARVDALSREIDEMRAGRRLQRFILERHTSAEYRQHLGLVNLIRNDFEKLSDLLSKARAEREQEREQEREKEKSASAAPTPPGTSADANKPEKAAADGTGTVEGTKEAQPPLPRIDRIVLYIDDLDRCPEDRVVEVLQAVHLLLAFPLFVVVVGVDSRWLLLSLEDHYAALRGRAGERKDSGAARPGEWTTTPQNYLEKIFQIPFTLRPMEPSGFGKLVHTLLPAAEPAGDPSSTEAHTGDRPAQTATATIIMNEAAGHETLAPTTSSDAMPAPSNPDHPVAGSAETAALDDSTTAETDGAATDEATDTEADETPQVFVRTVSSSIGATRDEPAPTPRPNPQGLTVEKHERDFVALLHPLIASPRALKRFTNVYRFLRVQQRGVELNRFRGTGEHPGQFQVAALLLSVVVGYPAEAPRLLRAVLTEPGQDLWELVEGLEEPAPAAKDTDDSGPARPTLKQALLELKPDLKLAVHPREVYTRWAREVARFSFQSGRILSLRDQKRESDEPQHA